MKEGEYVVNTNANSNVINKVFSQDMLNELINTGFSKILNYAYSTLTTDPDEAISNYEKIKTLYDLLNKNYRNEYFYKNTMINKILVGIHSVSTTTALSELPINNSIADLIMINGNAIVYEIKTELDSLRRIETQINDYYKAFANVSIVADKKHKEKILRKYRHSPVGIYTITNRNTISTIKKPAFYSEMLDPVVMFRILRKPERYRIVRSFYGEIPQFNQFEEFEELYKLFNVICIKDLYKAFIMALKERSNVKKHKEQFDTIPREIKSLVYFKNPLPLQYEKLDYSLK